MGLISSRNCILMNVVFDFLDQLNLTALAYNDMSAAAVKYLPSMAIVWGFPVPKKFSKISNASPLKRYACWPPNSPKP